MKRFTLLVVAWLIFEQGVFAQVDGLRVGAKAPALERVEWLYGSPAKSFERGMLYLVEFTHLSCKPCREAIPHLTELQKKYAGKLTVISVYSYYPKDSRSEGQYKKDIMSLKQRMGEKMDYTIALDTQGGGTSELWTGDRVFPMACLVDGEGRMAWTGLGNAENLSLAIGQFIEGDVNAQQLQAQQDAFDVAYSDAAKKLKIQTLREMLATVDSLQMAFPERQGQVMRLKFYTYLRHDREEANRFLRQTQHQWPDWTFDSAIFNYGHYDGLDLSLALENIDREMRGNQDVLMVATLKLKKGRLLIWHGNYAEALALLQETEFMRFSYTKLSTSAMEVSQGWQQVALFGLASQYGEQAASNWLEYHTGAHSLSYFATTTILNVFEGKLTGDQENMLEIYMKKQMEQRQEIP